MIWPSAAVWRQWWRNPPANAAVRDLGVVPGGEGPLEGGMAAHSSTLAWRIPWTEEPSRLQSIALQSQTQLKQPRAKDNTVVIQNRPVSRGKDGESVTAKEQREGLF